MTIFFVIEKQDNNFFLLFPVIITKLDSMFNVNFASFFVLYSYIFIAIKYPYDMGFACALTWYYTPQRQTAHKRKTEQHTHIYR